MKKILVSVVRCGKPLEPVRRAVELCGGLERIPAGAKVFIKPNIVFWTAKVAFPKWGVITTSRLVHDMVRLLKEHGVDDLTIGEGMVLGAGKSKDTAEHAFESLGYNLLARRYGVKVVNAFDRPFDKKNLGDGVELAFNRDALESDFIIDLPVMKTHAQAVVSLGIKNLKGLIDVNSRKICHNADLVQDLNFYVARLDRAMPPILTVIDGTYTAEYGPGFDAVVHRSDILAASWDVLAADMAGAALLGHDPAEVPHLVHAARIRERSLDMSGLEIRGERIEDLARHHNWSFPYNEDDSLPLPLARKGLRGVAYYKYRQHPVHLLLGRQWRAPHRPGPGLGRTALGRGGGPHRQADGPPPRGQEDHPPGQMHVPAPQGQPPH